MLKYVFVHRIGDGYYVYTAYGNEYVVDPSKYKWKLSNFFVYGTESENWWDAHHWMDTIDWDLHLDWDPIKRKEVAA